MFLVTTLFMIFAGILSSVLILRSDKSKKNGEISKLASEFEISEIDA